MRSLQTAVPDVFTSGINVKRKSMCLPQFHALFR